MRIAYIAEPWLPVPPPAYGGSEAVIHRLATGAAAAGHDVMLFSTGDSTCPVERRWERHRCVPELIGEATVELAHVIAAYEAVREWRADVVHDHTVTGPAYGRCRGDTPRITTNHGPFTADTRRIYADAARDTAVLAISQAQADTAGDIPIARVIHHGVDPAQYRVGDGRGGFYLFLGRMCPEKGVHEAALIARASGVRLLIAAKMREPRERAYFAEQVEPLLTDDIQFIGEVAGARKVELLGAATALLNPICWPEPFGLTMIEALACGTPVLSYARGSAPEIIDSASTGYVCTTRAEMVERVHQVAQLDRQACRRAVEGHFSAQRMVRDHLAVYQRLVERVPAAVHVAQIRSTATVQSYGRTPLLTAGRRAVPR